MVEQALRGWITSQGGYIHPDLHLFAEDLVKGRSVVALKGISKGTQLMKVPTSICLVASPSRSARGVADSAGEPSLADFLSSQRKLTPFLRLVLTVLHEYSEGPASAIQPFLQSLPTSHNCVLGWNSVERAALAGTTIEAEAATDIQATFHSIVQPIIRSRPELWKDEWATFPMFQRVCGVVQSRTFHLQEDNWLTGVSNEGTDLYMIPGIDMVNHSTDPTARNTSLYRKELPEAQDSATAGPMATEAPAAEPLAPAAPVPEAPASEAMAVDPPSAEAPAQEAPAAQVPATEAPAPAPEAPASEAPVTVAPAADALAAAVPPATEAAAADAPAPMVPDSDVPAPAMEAPPAPAAEAPASNGVATESFFVMEADADILSGSELLHSYGDLSDAQLLHIFGFVDTLNANFTNPHNEVHLPTETLVALCQEQKSGRRLGKNFKRRKDFLRDIDMLPEGFPVTMQDPIPDSLVTVTQILLMSDMAEFDDLKLEIQKEKKKNGNTAVLGKDTLDDSEHSMFVCTNLLRTIEEQLASFPEIPPSMEGANPTRAAQAAHVRAGEKAIVQAQKKDILQLMMNLDSDAEGDKDEEYF